MKRLVLCVAVFFFAGCANLNARAPTYYVPKPDGQYDNHPYLVDPQKMRLESIFGSIVKLYTNSVLEDGGGAKTTIENEGVGFVIGNKILTLDHVVSQYVLIYNTPFGRAEVPAKTISEKTYLVHGKEKILLKALYKNKEDDIALFEVPAGVSLVSFPYRIGNSDDLRVGNFIYVVGNPMNFGLNVREGIVSATSVPAVILKVDAKAENAFMVSNGLNPGDSSSPVVAIRDGQFELVGLSQGTFVGSQSLGWAIRINVICNILKKEGFNVCQR